MKKLIGLALAATLLVSGCGAPKLKNGEELVAKIDGYEVSANDVYNKMKKLYGTGITIDLIDAYIANKEVATDDEANKYVETQIQMYQLQYEDFESVLVSSGYSSIDEFKEVLLMSYKKNEVVKSYYASLLTEEQIKKYYDEEIYGEMDVKHILIKPEEKSSTTEQTAANEAALAEAKELIKKLDEGAKFDDLAKEYSDDTASATNGGLIEGVTKSGYVAEFFDASLALKDGEYSKEPVKSTYGYHVILKVKSYEKESYDKLKQQAIDELVDNVMSADTNAANKAWLEIRKNYKLEVFDKDVKTIYDSNADSIKNSTTEE